MEGQNIAWWKILDTDTQNFAQYQNGQQTINLGPGKYYLDVGGSNIGSLYTLSLTTDSAQPVINNIYSNPDKRYVDVIDPQSMLFNTGSIAGSIFINTSEEVALTDRGIELLDSQGNIVEVFLIPTQQIGVSNQLDSLK